MRADDTLREMKEEKGEDERRSGRRARTGTTATGERGREHDFDRGKVGALDREASRGWHNRKLSMSLESRERETQLAGARDSAFSVERMLLAPLRSYN